MGKLNDFVRRGIVLKIQRHPSDKLLTWKKVVEFSEDVLAGGISRQTLCNDDEIVAAYDAKKDALRGKSGKEPRSELEKARARIKQQNAVISVMKKSVSDYDEKLVLYVTNALRYVNLEKLSRPIDPTS